MAKSKTLLIALSGSVVGILGFFLPWITITLFSKQRISGFSLLGTLFGTGRNVLQELGYSAYFTIPGMLLLIALIALVFTGVYSVLMLRSTQVNKSSGIIITIVAGIAFLFVTGIAIIVSSTFRQQVGAYVDLSSYIGFGAGLFITSLGALVVSVAGFLIFKEYSPTNTVPTAQANLASLWSKIWGQKNSNAQSSIFTPSSQGAGLAQPPQGQVAARDQAHFHPIQPSPLPTAGNTPQSPYYQNASKPWETVRNQGGGLPNKPTFPQALPPTGQRQSPATGQPMQPWQGNPHPGQSRFTPSPQAFNQNTFPDQWQQDQFSPQPPLDKPWERVQYHGPSQAPRKPVIPPLQNSGQGRVWNPPPMPPYMGQTDPVTTGDYISPIDDTDMTRYDRDLGKNFLADDDDEFGA